jgi:fructose-1,6-bisphosphatase
MVDDSKTRKIMTKPLPQILDELVDSNKSTNERIDRVEQIAQNALQLAELLKLAMTEGNSAIDKRLSQQASTKES